MKLERSPAMRRSIITGCALPIDLDPFQRLFCTGHGTYVSLRMKKDLRALIESFVLHQTGVIVWVSASFTGIVRVGFVVSSLKQKGKDHQGKTNSTNVLIRADKKPETLITALSHSVLISVF